VRSGSGKGRHASTSADWTHSRNFMARLDRGRVGSDVERRITLLPWSSRMTSALARGKGTPAPPGPGARCDATSKHPSRPGPTLAPARALRSRVVPELPDVLVYLAALEERVAGKRLAGVRLKSSFLVRSAVPPLAAAGGREVRALRRLGKRLVFV